MPRITVTMIGESTAQWLAPGLGNSMNMGSNPSSATDWWANPGKLLIQYETRLPLSYLVGGMMMLPPHMVVRRLACERGMSLGTGLSILGVLH